MTKRVGRYAWRGLLVLVGLLALAAMWEAYKSWGPADGVSVAGTRILPRTTDSAMPHLSSIWDAFGSSEIGGSTISIDSSRTVLDSVLNAAWHSFQWALVGFVIGVVVGVGLAILMDRLRVAERAVMPYIVLSQTVPLIALAPLVTGGLSGTSLGGFQWRDWMSVSLIASYLAFFPVAVGMVRGLRSPTAVHTEYFRCTAAGYRQTLTRLKLPASVPYLLPALRLAAAGAVVGSIVAEISTGLDSGLGRLIISYSNGATGDPSRVYAAVLGAAVLGLIAASLVLVVDLGLRRFTRAVELR